MTIYSRNAGDLLDEVAPGGLVEQATGYPYESLVFLLGELTRPGNQEQGFR